MSLQPQVIFNRGKLGGERRRGQEIERRRRERVRDITEERKRGRERKT